MQAGGSKRFQQLWEGAARQHQVAVAGDGEALFEGGAHPLDAVGGKDVADRLPNAVQLQEHLTGKSKEKNASANRLKAHQEKQLRVLPLFAQQQGHAVRFPG